MYLLQLVACLLSDSEAQGEERGYERPVHVGQ
jgi:hypothetical protein